MADKTHHKLDDMFYVDDFVQPSLFQAVKSLVSDIQFGKGTVLGKDYVGFGHATFPIKALIEKVVGQPVEFVMSHVRIGKRSTPLTHFIHADNVAADYACVWCLSQPACDSGTAFWVHKETGIDRLELPCEPGLFEKFDKDIQDETKWDKVAYIPSVENRAVFFNSSLFHSRYPKELPISEDETPRIVSTIFFNILGEREYA